MGAVLSGCVRCATYCHDQYNEWRYMDYGAPITNTSTQGLDQITVTIPQRPTSSIFVAIQDGNMAEVLRHLTVSQNCTASCLNNHQESPLHLACRLGYGNIVICLLDHGCPAAVVTDAGSPLHSLVKAVRCGYISYRSGLQLMLNLVDKGCDINAIDKSRKTALYHAVIASMEQFIRGLLSLGADPNITENQYNFTCLHMATCQGDLNCIHAILEYPGVMLDALDNINRTPVFLALLNVMEYVQHEPWPNLLYATHDNWKEPVCQNRYKRMAIVEALVTAGADLNLKDCHDRSPMELVHSLLVLELLRYSKVMGYVPGESGSEGEDINPETSRGVQESVFAPMVRLMVMFGAQFPGSHLGVSFMRCADWMKKICDEDTELPLVSAKNRREPIKLVNQCRLTIRRHMAKISRLHCIEFLPLPSHLIAYVQLKYM